MRKIFLIISTLSVVTTVYAQTELQSIDSLAKPLGEAYVSVCEKIQTCARQEFSLANIPEEHAQVLNQALDGLCVGVYRSVERLALYPVLEAQAVACGESLLQLSCDKLAEDRNTEACQALIEAASKEGLELN
jgi:hypothetical protein